MKYNTDLNTLTIERYSDLEAKYIKTKDLIFKSDEDVNYLRYTLKILENLCILNYVMHYNFCIKMKTKPTIEVRDELLMERIKDAVKKSFNSNECYRDFNYTVH